MEEDADAAAVARVAIVRFGSRAAELMDQRADAHRREAESEGETFWRRVAAIVRATTTGESA
jgi:hypothetical protein